MSDKPKTTELKIQPAGFWCTYNGYHPDRMTPYSYESYELFWRGKKVMHGSFNAYDKEKEMEHILDVQRALEASCG